MVFIKNTELDVFPLCLGANTFGWTADEIDITRILDGYCDVGGNFIDTADVYPAWAQGCEGGESETLLGDWLSYRGKKEDLIIATKVGKWDKNPGLSFEAIITGCHDSLKRLDRDYIDIYYAHAEDLSVDIEETVSAFAELQQEGRITHIGLSNHSGARIEEWVHTCDELMVPRPVIFQPHYNLVWRREYEGEIQEIITKYDFSVVTYFSLASGFLTGKYRSLEEIQAKDRTSMVQPYVSARSFHLLKIMDEIAKNHQTKLTSIAIAWLLTRPAVVAPIASVRNIGQLPDILEGLTLKLTAEEVSLLDKASEELPQPPELKDYLPPELNELDNT